VLSLALAALAEFALIVAALIAHFSGNRNHAIVAFPVGWPPFYAVVYAIAYAIAVVDRSGPVLERYPQWYQALFPPFVRDLLNSCYAISPNIVLLVFPMFMAFTSAVIVWAAPTGQLNP